MYNSKRYQQSAQLHHRSESVNPQAQVKKIRGVIKPETLRKLGYFPTDTAALLGFHDPGPLQQVFKTFNSRDVLHLAGDLCCVHEC